MKILITFLIILLYWFQNLLGENGISEYFDLLKKEYISKRMFDDKT